MIEPPGDTEPTPLQSLPPSAAETVSSQVAADARLRSSDSRAECVALARTGTWVGWGLVVLGLLTGLERIVASAIGGATTTGEWVHACGGALVAILAYGLVGLGAAAIARTTASAVQEYLDRIAQVSDELRSLVARGVGDLDRIAQVLEQGGAWAPRAPETGTDRTGLLAEIKRATRASQWAEAESLLAAFAAEFPDDSRQSVLAAELAQARHRANQQQLAKLEAAREVNDPEGVLESYQLLVGSLEADARAALDRDLARWFLALIHRRLRTTKIQPDVVLLASRFAEAFASTVEGASVRAALPTLRRSVGLCPRCGSAYAGIGNACPKCVEAMSLRPDGPDLDAQVAYP